MPRVKPSSSEPSLVGLLSCVRALRILLEYERNGVLTRVCRMVRVAFQEMMRINACLCLQYSIAESALPADSHSWRRNNVVI